MVLVRLLFIFTVFLIGLDLSCATVLVVKARAYIFIAQKSVEEDNGSNLSGIIDFIQLNGSTVQVKGNLSHIFPESQHGFHIHMKGDIDNNCLSSGSHFNPGNKTHGAPTSPNRHVGDLGNIKSNSDGEVILNVTDTVISLNGPNSIIGRAVVVHEKADDLGLGEKESLTTGNAGKRIACGVIGILEESVQKNGAASSITHKFEFVNCSSQDPVTPLLANYDISIIHFSAILRPRTFLSGISL